tara:strand:- start:7431 stop:8036 length:606 start_codon:yes stop_codon:yes gene_type:complete
LRVSRLNIGGLIEKDPPKEPPKGYKYNEAGNLVPIDFEEFHEENDLDMEDLMRGVSQAESAGGELMLNPYSSATGEYGQLYNEIKDLQFMQGISRDEFSRDRDLQKKVFKMRVEGNLPNIPSLEKNAYDLTDEYAPQLGDKWDFTLDEVAAISNYLGRQGARNYFASIRDNTEYIPSGTVNKPVEEYLQIYRSGRDASYEE